MLMIGIAGLVLAAVEREWLRAPAVSGLVLFSRNYRSRAQLAELVASIREVRGDDGFIIAVDQEGGPVQRFRDGFTRLPALARLGELWNRDQVAAVAMAEEHAWVMASELRASDVDLSLAPVLDLARGNRAIGERALHADPEAVGELGQACIRGMHLAGMAATLKHFPGHGSIVPDTHKEMAVDRRPLADLRATDMVPFVAGLAAGAEAVMLAHVIYPEVDAHPAGQSAHWIKHILRGELGFRGLVMSDDISMAAAGAAGGIGARLRAHLAAGCDLILACQPDAVPAALSAVQGHAPCAPGRVAALHGNVASTWASLEDNPQRDEFIAHLGALTT